MAETRMCVNCGKTVPASHPRHEPLPECLGPDGFAACTFDMTLEEGWHHWRQKAHALRATIAEQAATIARLEGEWDALEQILAGERNMLVSAWLDRGETLPGAEKQSTIQRVLRGIHDLREAEYAALERAMQAEAERAALTARVAELEALLVRAEAHIEESRTYSADQREMWRGRPREPRYAAEVADADELLAVIRVLKEQP